MIVKEKIFDFLNNECEYAVLRNFEGLPNNCISRDIDLIVKKSEYAKIEKAFIDIIHSCEYKVVLKFTSERFNTIIIGNAINKDLIQFDFFFHTSARGIIIFDAEEMLEKREFNGSVYHVASQYEFLDKFLFNISVGHKYPEKYTNIKTKAASDILVSNLLNDVTGINNIDDVEKLSSKKIRRMLLMKSLKKRGFRQIFHIFLFLYYNMYNLIFPQGVSIGFTGPDGVGKTTVLEMIKESLETVVSEVYVLHFRPNLMKNLGDTLYDARINKKVDHNYSQPHRGKNTGKISSLCRLGYYTIDYIFGYYKKVRPMLYRRAVVIFDRYYTDIITDSRRSKISLGVSFLTAYRILIPKLQYNLLITASDNAILGRKRELDTAAIGAIKSRMNKLKNYKGYYMFSNETTPDVIVTEVLKFLYEIQDKKYT